MIGVLILIIGELWLLLETGDMMALISLQGMLARLRRILRLYLGGWGNGELSAMSAVEERDTDTACIPILSRVQLPVPRRALEADRGQRLRLNPRAVPTRPTALRGLNFLCPFLSFLI